MVSGINYRILTIILILSHIILGSCKSNKKSSDVKRIDQDLSSSSGNCETSLQIVEQLPVIDPQNLKTPKITVESVQVLNARGARTGNTQAKISVTYEQNDPNANDKPDVIYYRFCNKTTASQSECLNAEKGESLVLNDRNDGIISNYQSFVFNPGISEKQVFEVYAWSCVWRNRANNLTQGVVTKYPTQFGNRMLVCQQENGQATGPYYQDKNQDQKLRSLMVDNFDNQAGMKGLAYLSLTRFDRYLQETKTAKLSSAEQRVALQLESNLALGEYYGLFLASNFEQLSSDLNKKSRKIDKSSEKTGLNLSNNFDDCEGYSENEPATPEQEQGSNGSEVPLPPTPSGESGTLEYPGEDIDKQEIIDCERRGPEFEFIEGKCWHKQADGEHVTPVLEEETKPIEEQNEETGVSVGAKLGAWTLIFAGTVTGLASTVGLSQGIKASRISSDTLVDPFFRRSPSIAAVAVEAQGSGKSQTISLPAAEPASKQTFSQRYATLKQSISKGVHKVGISSLQNLGGPENLGKSQTLSPADSKALKAAGRRLTLGSVTTGLLSAAMISLGAVTKEGFKLEADSKSRKKERNGFLTLHEDLDLFFQNFRSFKQKYKINAKEIEELLN